MWLRPGMSKPRCRPAFSATTWIAGGRNWSATLPIRRVVGPADVAATVIHLMANTAVTGATYDVDGGQQLIP